MPYKDKAKSIAHDRERWVGERRDKFNKRRRESGKIKREAEKMEVLTHYSKQTLGCAFCGEQEIEFLTIDHIEGRQNLSKRENIHGDHLYAHLKKSGFPIGHQVLCFNCNNAKENMKRIGVLSLKPRNVSVRNNRKKVKIEVFSYYSKGMSKCSCCGISQINFLTIDHIHGRKVNDISSDKTGHDSYAHLKKSGFPIGHQVLCFNCNFSKDAKKEFKGICVHKRHL